MEILFKGFQKCEDGTETAYIDNQPVQGKWLEGSLVLYRDEAFIIPNGCVCFEPNEYNHIKSYTWCYFPTDLCRIDLSTLCQYSNKTDKSGVKVFDGDICYDDVRECNIIVSYSNDLMCWILVGNGWDSEIKSKEFEHLSVIGSIHTTTELMGERNDTTRIDPR